MLGGRSFGIPYMPCGHFSEKIRALRHMPGWDTRGAHSDASGVAGEPPRLAPSSVPPRSPAGDVKRVGLVAWGGPWHAPRGQRE